MDITNRLSLRDAVIMVKSIIYKLAPDARWIDNDKPINKIAIVKLVREVSQNWYNYGFSDGYTKATVEANPLSHADKLLMVAALGDMVINVENYDHSTRARAISLRNRILTQPESI